jgi:hypothetical protein
MHVLDYIRNGAIRIVYVPTDHIGLPDEAPNRPHFQEAHGQAHGPLRQTFFF